MAWARSKSRVITTSRWPFLHRGSHASAGCPRIPQLQVAPLRFPAASVFALVRECPTQIGRLGSSVICLSLDVRFAVAPSNIFYFLRLFSPTASLLKVPQAETYPSLCGSGFTRLLIANRPRSAATSACTLRRTGKSSRTIPSISPPFIGPKKSRRVDTQGALRIVRLSSSRRRYAAPRESFVPKAPGEVTWPRGHNIAPCSVDTRALRVNRTNARPKTMPVKAQPAPATP